MNLTTKEININDIICDCDYHIAFCTKYKKDVLINEVKEMLEDILKEEAKKLCVEIKEINIHENYVHLFISCHTVPGVHIVIKKLKDRSAKMLMDTFPKLKSSMPNMWTRKYFCSTSPTLDVNLMERYIESEITRSKKTYK
ncbi:IS200/IS605 family transposase [Clostridioides sp. GD02377]|uniref:IS200/IS605 family transposase n=1 Tax=unclassified Clostridioides TaxID=2635829 RepID=UPI00389D7CE8